MTSGEARVQVLTFYLLALAIASAMVALTYAMHATNVVPDLVKWLYAHNLYPNILTIAWYGLVARQPMVLRVFFFAGAPTIAALVIAKWSGGGVGDLLSRLRPWCGSVAANSAGITYAAIFAVYFAVFGAYYWMTWSAGEIMASVQIAMIAGLPYTALRDAILTHPTLLEGLVGLFSSVPSAAKSVAATAENHP